MGMFCIVKKMILSILSFLLEFNLDMNQMFIEIKLYNNIMNCIFLVVILSIINEKGYRPCIMDFLGKPNL